MESPTQHRGVAIEDPRNAGPISHFRPRVPTRAEIRARLTAVSHKSPEAIEADIDALERRVRDRPEPSEPPMSQSWDSVANPWFSLGAHPELIKALWSADDSLPQRCRWVFWARPALVHPLTGVVFALAIGTMGWAIRLPTPILEAAEPSSAVAVISEGPGAPFDIRTAGAEWRLVRSTDWLERWIGASYHFAGLAAQTDT